MDSMQSLLKSQWNFSEKKKKNLKICTEQQNPLNRKSNIKKEQSQRHHMSSFQTILQNYSNQNNVILA